MLTVSFGHSHQRIYLSWFHSHINNICTRRQILENGLESDSSIFFYNKVFCMSIITFSLGIPICICNTRLGTCRYIGIHFWFF